MEYYLDLKTKSMIDLKTRLTCTRLIPSQKILLDNIDGNFKTIESHGITTMFDLSVVLKTKQKVEDFANLSGISQDYLTILRREVNSYQPSLRKIADFPCIKPEICAKLLAIGIKNTKKLFYEIYNKRERGRFVNKIKISDEDGLLLAKLTDFSRMRYVNPAFATLLINSSFDTIDKIKKAKAKDLFNELVRLNDNNKYYKGKIGLGDMEIFINDAKFISSGLEI